jgi:hypothetical protein
MSYNPKPTRVWSRVQHPCTFIVDGSYNSAFSPLTGRTTSLLEADYYNKLLYKGNILQYKKNTSNLTKSQRYSQICKGMWTNRTKSYATQTQTYTNPNTSNLKQVNFINVPTNGVTTYIPGPFNFNIPAPNGCPSNVIKEGGSLLCNTIVNPCTDEEIKTTTVLECYPTYCSDVPGPIIDLCWNSKLDTWYPRQNLTMPTSGDKWPEGYKGLVSAVRPYASVLSLLSLINTTATLNWSVVNNDCIPISSYNIYENGRLIANVPYPTNSFTYTNCDTNTYYITSISGTTESEPSNIITITSPPQQLEAPVLSLDSSMNNTATFSWTFVNNDCIPISSFNIYENGIVIANVPYPTNSATFTVCGGNSFSVTSVSGTTESQQSSPPIPINLPITPPVLTGVNNNNNTATLSWTINTPCNITQFNIFNASTGSQIGSVNYPTNTFIVLLIGGNNSFYVTATVSGGNTSGNSNTLTVYNPSSFVTNGSVSSSSGVYTVTFTQTTVTGSITFNNNSSPINVILVGGGGGAGGGGRVTSLFAIDGGGGGGGGETLSFTQTSYYNGTPYNVIIGGGGTGGSWDSNGIYTFPTFGSQSTIFSNIAHGGYAPEVFIAYGAEGGGIPTTTTPPPFTQNGGPYVTPPNTGGGTNGNSGTALGITNGTSYGGGSGGSGSFATGTFPPNYSLVAGGGGGGTGYPSIAVGQGGGGGNGGSAGVGGTNSGGAGAPSNGSNGQNATSYGGGGGGGSGAQSDDPPPNGNGGSGGNGGNGICVLTFSLTYPP